MLQPLPGFAAKFLITRVCQRNPNESVGRACMFSKRVPQICVAILYRHLDQSWNELSISATVGKWLFASICPSWPRQRRGAASKPRTRPLPAARKKTDAALQLLLTGRSRLGAAKPRWHGLLCGTFWTLTKEVVRPNLKFQRGPIRHGDTGRAVP